MCAETNHTDGSNSMIECPYEIHHHMMLRCGSCDFHKHASRLAEMRAAPINTVLIAGRDIMLKVTERTWWRQDDDSCHNDEDIVAFHTNITLDAPGSQPTKPACSAHGEPNCTADICEAQPTEREP